MNLFVRAAALASSLSLLCFDSPAADAQAPNPSFGSPSPGIAYTMGDVGRRATYGSDGRWRTTASSDGSLTLTNEKDTPGWTANIVRSPPVPYAIDIQVRSNIAEVEGHAVGGGVVFGYQRASGTSGPKFFAAMIAGDTLFVYEVDESFQQMLRSSQNNVSHTFADVHIDVRADGFSISVNGDGSSSQDVDRAMTGEVGVIASGFGEATFRNLTVK